MYPFPISGGKPHLMGLEIGQSQPAPFPIFGERVRARKNRDSMSGLRPIVAAGNWFCLKQEDFSR